MKHSVMFFFLFIIRVFSVFFFYIKIFQTKCEQMYALKKEGFCAEMCWCSMC